MKNKWVKYDEKIKCSHFFLVILIITSVGFVSGCTSHTTSEITSTTTSSSTSSPINIRAELKNNLDSRVSYTDFTQILYDEDTLEIEFVGNFMNDESSTYEREQEIASITIDTFLKKDAKTPKFVIIKGMHDTWKEKEYQLYESELSWDDFNKIANLEMSFLTWTSKTKMSTVHI